MHFLENEKKNIFMALLARAPKRVLKHLIQKEDNTASSYAHFLCRLLKAVLFWGYPLQPQKAVLSYFPAAFFQPIFRL
jgi:hypothetical protein